MALVDDKLAHNRALEVEAEQRKAQIEAMFLAQFGERLTQDQRAELRAQQDAVDDDIASRRYDIEAREWGINVSYSSTEAPEQVIYGKTRVGGIISFITTDEGEDGQYLHMFVTYAGHQCDQILDLYIDGEKVDFSADTFPNGKRVFGWSTGDKWGGSVFLSQVSNGNVDQVANVDLRGQSDAHFPGLWTESHRQRGKAGAYLILFYKAELFPNGPPEIAFDVKGEDRILDPRTNTRGWTNNAALCLAHYLVESSYGPKYTWAEIDTDSLIAAANICDQDVALSGGGTENRYTVNGKFEASSSNNHQKIINDFKMAMAGDVVYSCGKFYMFAGAWTAPVMDLNEDHLLSALDIKVKPSKAEIFNAVKGKHQTAESSYEVVDYPPVMNSTYQSQDGELIFEELDLPFTDSSSRAQRIAKIFLESSRQWIIVSGTYNFLVYKLRPGDIIRLTHERLGFENKTFRVVSYNYRPREGSPVIDIPLVLREIAEGVYEWDEEETVIDLAPNTTLPDPSFVRQPTNLSAASGTEQLDIRSDGTVFSRVKLSWAQSTDLFVTSGGNHEIQYKKSSDLEWRPGGIIGGRDSNTYVLDVLDGVAYDFRVRAFTPIAASAWTQLIGHTVLGKLEPPSAPTYFYTSIVPGGIRLDWSPIQDKDLSEYEIRLGSTFGSSVVIDNVKSTSYTYKTVNAGTHVFRLRARDTSRNFSSELTSSIVIAPPGPVRNISIFSLFNSLRINWLVPELVNFRIDKYNIYRGEVFNDAIFIASVNATIFTYQEQTSGTYYYWIEAVDEHGNKGQAVRAQVNIQTLPFLELIYDQILDPADAVLTNMVLDADGSIVGSVSTTQTWASLLSARGWSTWSDKITAGYGIWGTPTVTSGQIKYTIDYGSLIDSSGIVVNYEYAWASGDGLVETTIRWSPNNSTWTSESGNQVVAENFRYLEVIIDITPDDDQSIVNIKPPRVIIEVAKVTDSVVVAANSADTTGTLVVWNKDFIDIFETSIKAALKGSNAYFPTFTITGNSVRIFLWNTSGARVSGDVVCSCEGIIARV